MFDGIIWTWDSWRHLQNSSYHSPSGKWRVGAQEEAWGLYSSLSGPPLLRLGSVWLPWRPASHTRVVSAMLGKDNTTLRPICPGTPKRLKIRVLKGGNSFMIKFHHSWEMIQYLLCFLWLGFLIYLRQQWRLHALHLIVILLWHL